MNRQHLLLGHEPHNTIPNNNPAYWYNFLSQKLRLRTYQILIKKVEKLKEEAKSKKTLVAGD